eukprot:g4336.t1
MASEHYEFPRKRNGLEKAKQEGYANEAYSLMTKWLPALHPGKCRELARDALAAAQQQEAKKGPSKAAFTGGKKDNWGLMDGRDYCIWVEDAVPNWSFEDLEPIFKDGEDGRKFLEACGMPSNYKPPQGKDRKVTAATCQGAVNRYVRQCVNADYILRDMAQKIGHSTADVEAPNEEWLARARALTANKTNIGQKEEEPGPSEPLALMNDAANETYTAASSSRRAAAPRRPASPANRSHSENTNVADRSRTAKRNHDPAPRTDSQTRMLASGTSLFVNTDSATGTTTFSEKPQPGGQNKVATLKTGLTMKPPATAPKTGNMIKPKPLVEMIELWSDGNVDPSDLAALVAAHKAKIAKWQESNAGTNTPTSSSTIALPGPTAKKEKKPTVITVSSKMDPQQVAAASMANSGATMQPELTPRQIAARKREATRKQKKEDDELEQFFEEEMEAQDADVMDSQEISEEIKQQLDADPALKKEVADVHMADQQQDQAATEGELGPDEKAEDVFSDLDVVDEGPTEPARAGEEEVGGNTMVSESQAAQGAAEEKGEDAPAADPYAGMTEEEKKALGVV